MRSKIVSAFILTVTMAGIFSCEKEAEPPLGIKDTVDLFFNFNRVVNGAEEEF